MRVEGCFYISCGIREGEDGRGTASATAQDRHRNDEGWRAHGGIAERHKTGFVDRLREHGRHEEAVLVENGAGFSLSGSADGVVWIISGGRRQCA